MQRPVRCTLLPILSLVRFSPVADPGHGERGDSFWSGQPYVQSAEATH